MLTRTASSRLPVDEPVPDGSGPWKTTGDVWVDDSVPDGGSPATVIVVTLGRSLPTSVWTTTPLASANNYSSHYHLAKRTKKRAVFRPPFFGIG